MRSLSVTFSRLRLWLDRRPDADRSPSWADGTLALCLFVADLVELRFLHSLYWPEREIAAWPVLIAIAAFRAGLLVFRRRCPLLVTVMVSATLITIPTNDLGAIFRSYAPAFGPNLAGDPGYWPTAFGWTALLEVLVTIYAVTGIRGKRWGALAGLWHLVCMFPWLTPQVITYGPAPVVLGVLVLSLAVFVGDVRQRMMAAFSLIAERTARIEKGRRSQAKAAVRIERERISNDLQGLVVRNLREMVDLANSARRLLVGSSPPTDIGKAISEIERTGRSALTEARRALGLLRRDGESSPLKPATRGLSRKGVELGERDMFMPQTEGRKVTKQDVLVFVALVAYAVSELGISQPGVYPWEAIEELLHPVEALSVTLFSVPLLLRRFFPLAAALFVTVGFGLHAAFGEHFGIAATIALLIAVYSAWAEGGASTGSGVVLAAVAVLPIAQEHLASVFQFGILTLYLAFLPGACTLGWQKRRLTLATQELKEQEAELRRLAQAELEQARVEERLRIARELHDVTAHSLSVMTIQASAARTVADTEPDKARDALSSVEETGRTSLGQIEGMFAGVTRPEDESLGIDALPALATTMRQAGLAVDVEVGEPDRPLTPALDLSIYRVVQEALTNAAKHAGATTVKVRVHCDAHSLTVRVEDDGGASVESDRLDGVEGGHGLIGIRERLAAYGGTLTVAAAPDGFRLDARVPLTVQGNEA